MGQFKIGTSSYGSDSDNYKVQFAVDVPLIPGELSFDSRGLRQTRTVSILMTKTPRSFPNAPIYGSSLVLRLTNCLRN